MYNTDTPLQRGDVYYAALGDYLPNNDHIQKGRRPVIIISSMAACATSDVLTVIPLTTSQKCTRYPKMYPLLTLPVPNAPESFALCNQIVTINRFDLTDRYCHLSARDMTRISQAVAYCLDIPLFDEDKAYINSLYEQGRFIIQELQQLVPEACVSIPEQIVINKVKRPRRTEQEIQNFLYEWSNSTSQDKHKVQERYGFSNYNAAAQFYSYHRKRNKAKEATDANIS